MVGRSMAYSREASGAHLFTARDEAAGVGFVCVDFGRAHRELTPAELAAEAQAATDLVRKVGKRVRADG